MLPIITTYTANPNHYYGNLVDNYDFFNGTTDWTISDIYWAWDSANNRVTRTAGAASMALKTTVTPTISGAQYTLIYSLPTWANAMCVVFDGKPGLSRSAAGTYKDDGSNANTFFIATSSQAVIEISSSSTGAGTIDGVQCYCEHAFTPYSSNGSMPGREISFWHGGDVLPETKHLMNMGAWTNLIASAPGVMLLVDIVGEIGRAHV